MEKYIRWKFRGQESGDVEGLLIALMNDKVVGQLGLIPVKLKHENKIYDAQWACDLMVDPEFRKTGIGNKLFSEALSRDMISLGNNPSPRAEKVMLDIGFKPLQSGRTMVFPLDVNHLMNWALPDKLKFSIPVISRMVQPYYSFKKNNLLRSESEFMETEWKNISELILENQEGIDFTGIYHDEDFLNWRAGGLENYTSEIKAMKNSNNSYALHSEFKPYYQIYEWCCRYKDDIKEMLSEVFRSAVNTEARTIQIIANNATEENLLSKAGFIRSRNMERIIYFSNKLTIEEKRNFYFTLYDTDLNL